jgi:hypothetical protein
MNNDQLEWLAAREVPGCCDAMSDINAFVAEVVEKLRKAHSLYEIECCYRSAYSHLERAWRPKIGYGRKVPGQQEIMQAYRTAYDAKIRERRREYQREYMRRWRAANPEKAKAQNRKAARAYREARQFEKDIDEYYARLDSLTPTFASS